MDRLSLEKGVYVEGRSRIMRAKVGIEMAAMTAGGAKAVT
jgi:hypothetical protein